MKVLNIGIARGLFDKDSASYKWAITQSKSVDEINTIVFTLKKQGFNEIHTEKYHLYPTNSKSKLGYYFDAFKIAKKIIKNAGDIVVSSQDPIESGVISYIIAKYFKKPFHVQLHFDVFNKYWLKESKLNIIKKYISICILKRANHVRVVAEFLRKKLLEIGIPDDKISNVPVFVDINDFKRNDLNHKEEFSDGSFIFVSVGRFTYQKNYLSLINVFSKILKINPKAILVLVGKGELLEDIKNEIDRLSIGDSVKIIEWTNDVSSWYRTANVYVQPSLYEGWGMCVIEAMASSVPVIMSRTGCADEVVINNKSGLVIELNNEDNLFDAMKTMMEDNSLKNNFISGGLEVLNKLPSSEQSLSLYKKGWELANLEYQKN